MIDSAISKYIQKLWRYTNDIIHYIIYIHICSHLRHSLDAFHCIPLLIIPVACVDHLKYRFLNLDKSFFTSKKTHAGKIHENHQIYHPIIYWKVPGICSGAQLIQPRAADDSWVGPANLEASPNLSQFAKRIDNYHYEIRWDQMKRSLV